MMTPEQLFEKLSATERKPRWWVGYSLLLTDFIHERDVLTGKMYQDLRAVKEWYAQNGEYSCLDALNSLAFALFNASQYSDTVILFDNYTSPLVNYATAARLLTKAVWNYNLWDEDCVQRYIQQNP
jgi:hypothetical protein